MTGITVRQIADKLVGIINADNSCKKDNITASLEMSTGDETQPNTPVVVTTAVPGELGKPNNSEMRAILGSLLSGKLVTPETMHLSSKADGPHLAFDA